MAIIIGTAGDDALTGTETSDEIYGLAGNDILEGGDGDDILDGGEGDDWLEGGLGDDVYILGADDYDWIVEEVDGGIDEIRTARTSISMAANVENFTSTGNGPQWVWANDLDNVIRTGAGDSYVSAEGGDDTVYYSAGVDSIHGGSGFDVFVLPGGESDYIVIRMGSAVSIRPASGDPSSETRIWDFELIEFGDGAILDPLTFHERHGSADDDTLTGDEGDNDMFGYGGDDILYGLGGDDVIDGGTGADTMVGGDGHDTYWVDDAGDVVVEAVGAPGFDTVFLTGTWFSIGDSHVEEVWAMNASDTTVLGGATFNSIYGDLGNDWLEGRGGDDYLSGSFGDDRLDGGAGHDELNGGPGNDTMIGGTGNDLYHVQDAGDVVVEAAGAGTDTVLVYLQNYTLPANVENAELQWFDGHRTITGNGLSNVITIGTAAATVNGGAGNDTVVFGGGSLLVDLATGEMGGTAADDVLISIENVTGGWGDDVLRGTSGANILDGGPGGDLMVGRGGNDIYFIDSSGDVVVELPGEGTDEVRIRYFPTTYVMPDNVEKLRNVGSNYTLAAIGNALNNDMIGGAEVDWFHGGDGHDSLTGGGGDDHLFGGAGHDTLSGGTGADEMVGGEGNDAYIVDNPGDTVTELPGEGVDTVYVSLSTYTIPAEVENLHFNGSGDFQVTGNAQDNVVWSGSGADLLMGGAGNDELRGGGGNDTLLGQDGNDILVGGGGTDILSGGAGADQFRFASYETGTGAAADRITDFVSGTDVVDLSAIDADFNLAGNQAFTFIGAAAFSGTAGELRYAFDGSDTRLQMDINGDGFAEFEIVLSGTVTPLVTDFIL